MKTIENQTTKPYVNIYLTERLHSLAATAKCTCTASKIFHYLQLLTERISKSGFSISSPEASLKETLAYRAFNEARIFLDTELLKVLWKSVVNAIYCNGDYERHIMLQKSYCLY